MTDMEQQREARKKALRLLEHMDRTEKGLTDRLLRAGFSEELAEDAVSYVKDYGYINDRRYALNYIMYRIHDKSRQKIFQELPGRESTVRRYRMHGRKQRSLRHRMRGHFSARWSGKSTSPEQSLMSVRCAVFTDIWHGVDFVPETFFRCSKKWT